MVTPNTSRRSTAAKTCIVTTDTSSIRAEAITSPQRSRTAKPGARIGWLVFVLLSLPFWQLIYLTFSSQLGVNPVETLTHQTGLWALRCLLLTLAMTPLRRFTGYSWPVQIRRQLGLYCFFYACLHFTIWWLFDHALDFAAMGRDVLKRPYITVGMSAFVCLLPLALTSTNGMVRRLGGQRWKALHRLVYLIGVLVILHFWWLVKADIREPALYAVLFASLMLARWRPQVS